MEPETLQFEVVRHVTLPLLKLPEDGTPTYLRFTSKIVQAKELTVSATRRPKGSPEGTLPTNTTMPAPDIVEVVNLQNNQPFQLIVNTVLGSNLKEQYPNDDYVNKCFQLRTYKAAANKRYKTFEILEIKLKNQSTVNAAVKPVAKK